MEPERSVLALTLIRAKDAHDPEHFDREPQDYYGSDETVPYGKARLPWDAIRPDVEKLIDPDPPPSVSRRLGDTIARFLEDLLKRRTQNWPRIESALLSAEEGDKPITLKLRLGAVELFEVPWELTRLSSGQPLGHLRHCVIQYEWVPSHIAASRAQPSDRLLFAWARPYQQVPVPEHRQALQAAHAGFNPELDELREMTLDNLRGKLAKANADGAPVRVLHLLCHGTKIANETFGLALHPRDPQGDVDRVTGSQLVAAMGEQLRGLQCVVLSACHSSNASAFGNMVGGVAHELHRSGIPAVIASRLPLSAENSVRFTAAFYQALYRDHASISDAFRVARAALGPAWFDWASLQLFVSEPPAAPREATKVPPRTQFPETTQLPPPVRNGLAVLVEVNMDISSTTVLDALDGRLGDAPDLVVFRPLPEVSGALPAKPREWKVAFKELDRFAALLVKHVANTGVRTVHIFACAPLPLMFQLGFRLARQPLRAYQQHERWNWSWSEFYKHDVVEPRDMEPFFQQRWPDPDSAGERIVVTVEVTRSINDSTLVEWLGEEGARTAVRLVPAAGPSQASIKDALDVARAAREFQDCLDRIGREFHQTREIWLAMVCPASLALALGRVYRPNAQKPIVLFNYRPKEGYVEVSRPT